jgi:hypothetical protein
MRLMSGCASGPRFRRNRRVPPGNKRHLPLDKHLRLMPRGFGRRHAMVEVFRCSIDQVVKTNAAAVEGPISSIVYSRSPSCLLRARRLAAAIESRGCGY